MLYVIVFVGAGIGGALRHGVNVWAVRAFGFGFPFGTLIVNVLGSVAVGYVLTWSADHTHDRWRLLAATGFCGGFTTFSAYAFESMEYLRIGQIGSLALNIVLNNSLAFAGAVLGVWLHRAQ